MSGWFSRALPYVVCLIALPGLAHLAGDQWLGIAALFALLFGCLLLGAALLRSQRRLDHYARRNPDRRTASVREAAPKTRSGMMNYRGCVSEGTVGQSVEFSLVFETGIGRYAYLAPAAGHHAGATKPPRGLRGCCGLPDPAPVENPLDAANAGIPLGQAGQPRTRSRAYRAAHRAALACVLSTSVPHRALERQIDPALGIAVWSLGAIVAFALLPIRALYRPSACWIVRDGDIRIERLSLNGTTDLP